MPPYEVPSEHFQVGNGLSNPSQLNCSNRILSSMQFNALSGLQPECTEPEPGAERPPVLEDFRYQGLDYSSRSFRLLIIRPEKAYDMPIECELFHSSVDEQMDYSALSYCWGNDDKTSEIAVNGKRFFITANLEVALRDLRLYGQHHATDIASIWIDAICINQDSNAERSHQVGQMDLIYSGAERTIVWLGPMIDGMQFKTIRALDDLRTTSNAEVPKFRDILAERYGSPWSYKERSYLECAMYIVQSLFAHPWWSRIWVAQEIGLAKRAIALIGVRPIQWRDIKAAIKIVLACCEFVEWARISKGRHRSWETTLFHNVQRAAVLADLGPGVGRKKKSHLSELLLDFQSQQASNLQDRVYGLMGLAADGHKLNITPDYSTPLHLVSKMAMRDLLLQSQSLLPLALAVGVKGDTYQRAASWGLRLSHRSQPKNSLAALRNRFALENQKWAPLQKLQFHAGELNQSTLFHFPEDLEYLALTGYGIDTILVMDSTSNPSIKDHVEARIRWLPILKLQEYLPILSDWIPDPQNTSVLLPPDTELHPTVMKEFQLPHVATKQTQDKGNLVELFEITCCLGMLSPTCSAKDIEHRIDNTLQSHRISITANKLIALVPADAQPNDLICIVPGADLPLVLRKVPRTKGENPAVKEYEREAFFSKINSNMNGKLRRLLRNTDLGWGLETLESLKGDEKDHFYFVGEAYCNGMMFGEALPFKPTIDLRKFKLS